jgi:hypothetical protein
MNPIYIPFHSVIDLITNSSSEIFVSATEKTLEVVKDIISNALVLGGGDKTVDDLYMVL